MQKLSFSKYQGAGNDFIMLDATQAGKKVRLTSKQVALLCDRHKGIGADGMIWIVPSKAYDFEMVYYNADGNKGTFCGNGSRCAVQFATQQCGIAKRTTTFLAADGVHHASIHKNKTVSVSMRDVQRIQQVKPSCYVLHTGSPHYVKLTPHVESIDVVKQGKLIRYHKQFEATGGTNVNFVQALSPKEFLIATYERGVEDETLACGTGITAAALVLGRKTKGDQKMIAQAKGGQVAVSFCSDGKDHFTNVVLTGNATHVFDGEIFV